MNLEFSVLKLMLLINYFDYVKLVPDEYCLSALNISDCGSPPTAVFSYYKYGSRCEIEYWRGCPTKNMFENEFHCSHYCVGKTKYYGRERGSWKGRNQFSIDDLPLDELEDLNRILHKIDDSISDNSITDDSITDEPKEQLINSSPRPRPQTLRKKITNKYTTEVSSTPKYNPVTPKYNPVTPKYSPVTPKYNPVTPKYNPVTPKYNPVTNVTVTIPMTLASVTTVNTRQSSLTTKTHTTTAS